MDVDRSSLGGRKCGQVSDIRKERKIVSSPDLNSQIASLPHEIQVSYVISVRKRGINGKWLVCKLRHDRHVDERRQ